MKKSFLLALFIYFGIGFNALGQSYESEFTKIFRTYSEPGQILSWDVAYKYFPDPKTTRAIDSMKSDFKLYGTKYYYYSFGEQEFLKNEKYCIVVNHATQVIMIDKSSRSNPPVFDLQRLDSLVRLSKVNVTSLPNKKMNHGYRIATSEKSEIHQIDLWYDPTTFLIAKILLYYNDFRYGEEIHQPIVEITYSNYSKQTADRKDHIFSENQFVKVSGDKFLPASTLSTYQVFNNIALTHSDLK